MPKVSVIIRSFNEEKHLGDLLDALDAQTFRDYEVVLVDSGSTDRTLQIAEGRCDTIVEIESRDFTFGYSLNAGIERGEGEVMVIVSAHAIPVAPDWLAQITQPFEDADVMMAYGRHIGVRETKHSEQRDFAKGFGEVSFVREWPDYYANNANSAIRKAGWTEHPFDEYLTGLEDIAWAKYFMKQGKKVVYAAQAAVYHIHEESWTQVYNRYRREAVAAKKIGLRRPPHSTLHFGQVVKDALSDIATLGESLSLPKIQEVLLFRYHQWKGTVDGWKHDVDLEKERHALFYSSSAENRAVVISASKTASLQDYPMPQVKPGDVLIKVAYVGICGTDLEIFNGTLGYYKNGAAHYPIVPGHEYSGEVVKVGANEQSLKVGDRVVGECILSCGKCEHCESGIYTACEQRQEVGVVNKDGAYARYVALPAQYVHKVPDDVDLKTACLVEPLAVVSKGLRRIQDRIGTEKKKVAVIGAGPIGYLTALSLEQEGHEVTVFDRSKERLGYLNGNVRTSPHLDGLKQFDIIVEATGNVEVLERVMRESRTDSILLLLGFPYGNMEYNFEVLVAHEKTIVGSVGSSSQDFKTALETIKSINTMPLQQAVFPLESFQEAWRSAHERQHLKVLLSVN